MDLAAGQRRPGALGDLGDDVLFAVVEDRMDGIEAQAVEVIFLEPVERVVDEEVAHRPARRAPSKLRPAPQGVWCRSVKNDLA